jgi:hypothetical protein
MAINLKRYEVQLKSLGSERSLTKGGYAFITTAGSPRLATVYNIAGDVIANPVAFTGGSIKFSVADTINSVDVIFYDENGYAGVIPGVTPGLLRYGIDRNNLNQNLVIPFSYATQTTIATAFDCGIDEIAGVVYRPAAAGVKVTAADSGITLDFGNTADADGYIAAISVASAATVPALVTSATKVGAYGVTSVGTDSRTANRVGVAGQSLFYNLSSGADTAEGYIFIPTTIPLPPLS